MMNEFLKRFSPPGMDLWQEKTVFLWGLILSAFYSVFHFFAEYISAYNELFIRQGKKYILDTTAEMRSFGSLTGYSFIGFAAVIVIMAGFVIYHYAYYRQGSMSIYLMKRLPEKREIHIRALTLPLAAAAVCFLTACLLLGIFFAVYMLVTPKACL